MSFYKFVSVHGYFIFALGHKSDELRQFGSGGKNVESRWARGSRQTLQFLNQDYPHPCQDLNLVPLEYKSIALPLDKCLGLTIKFRRSFVHMVIISSTCINVNMFCSNMNEVVFRTTVSLTASLRLPGDRVISSLRSLETLICFQVKVRGWHVLNTQPPMNKHARCCIRNKISSRTHARIGTSTCIRQEEHSAERTAVCTAPLRCGRIIRPLVQFAVQSISITVGFPASLRGCYITPGGYVFPLAFVS